MDIENVFELDADLDTTAIPHEASPLDSIITPTPSNSDIPVLLTLDVLHCLFTNIPPLDSVLSHTGRSPFHVPGSWLLRSRRAS